MWDAPKGDPIWKQALYPKVGNNELLTNESYATWLWMSSSTLNLEKLFLELE